MKLNLIASLFVFTLFTTPCVAQFGAGVDLWSGSSTVSYLEAEDLDSDGFEDLVIVSNGQVYAMWNQGAAGIGVLGAPDPIGAPFIIRSLQVMDFDSDGNLDVLVGSDDGVHWYRGVGSRLFDPRQSLFFELASTGQFVTADLNGDGVADFVTHDFSFIHIYIADGAGGYQVTTSPDSASLLLRSILVTDWDQDAQPDVLVSSLQGDVSWVESDPAGVSTIQLLPVVGCRFITMADMDLDGDLDLVRSGDVTEIGWYENLGNGAVGALVSTGEIEVFMEAPVSIGDFDGDGDPDIAAAFDVITEHVLWIENIDGVALGPHNVIATGVDSFRSTAVGDFSRTGNPDILASNGLNPILMRFPNEFPLGPEVCPSNPTSMTSGATLSAIGSRWAQYNELTLRMENAPMGQFTVMQVSRGTKISFPGNSMGTRCLANPYSLYLGQGQVAQTSGAGEYSIDLDLTMTPDAGGFSPILSGETWYFQAWFRDRAPGPTSNFSSAIGVQFLGASRSRVGNAA